MQSVLIVEDHLETRSWLASIAREAFPNPTVGEVSTLGQAYAWLKEHSASLALIDLSLPDGCGTELLQYMQRHCPETYLVVTTIFDDDRHLFSALKAGASGYLLKDQPRQTMVEGLVGIMSGKPPLSPAVARRILRHFQQTPPAETENPLSEREEEVLLLLAKGLGRGISLACWTYR
ncbi:response regulator transcription factor [Alkalilimnicola ehrlichii]|uniref:response regulator n=1 Tax=Alkalilimnicola ehrlichii TaxID=351052 RepID=UPI001C6ECB44|nr:response regulator transcription factor [Alkalilimnicola ehrlichii]